jgi:hypothetical protein
LQFNFPKKPNKKPKKKPLTPLIGVTFPGLEPSWLLSLRHPLIMPQQFGPIQGGMGPSVILAHSLGYP